MDNRSNEERLKQARSLVAKMTAECVGQTIFDIRLAAQLIVEIIDTLGDWIDDTSVLGDGAMQ